MTAGSITEAEALQAEQARYAAQMSNDFAAMERLFGDDLVYIHSSTTVDTKASFIESMRSGAVKYRSMTRGEVKVRVFGSVAIITGSGTFEVTARGQDLRLELLFHAVWVKRAAGVQFVSWQATRKAG
jgi:3-deoxy-D-manno-octulosonate 8-phosphate phosphatase KdsC-like HAD superfamily phosphatase